MGRGLQFLSLRNLGSTELGGADGRFGAGGDKSVVSLGKHVDMHWTWAAWPVLVLGAGCEVVVARSLPRYLGT